MHLGLGGTHTHPMQQLQPLSAAAALLVAKASAGFAGSVAGLTFPHVLVAVEARDTFPHAAAIEEKEALLTPVACTLVTAATVSVACFAF